MKRLPLLLAGLLAALTPVSLQAASPGDTVVVIYNKAVPESKDVAEYYAKCRQVPADQVFGFDLPKGEAISRRDFRDDLQKPLAEALESKKLWHVGKGPDPSGRITGNINRVLSSKIRYAVLCYGVPLRITEDGELKEPEAATMRPEFRRNEAAVDSELACLPNLAQGYAYTGPARNPFYSVTNAVELNPTNGILMVARLDGPTAAIARGLVDKALEAETNGLWGRAYFDQRGLKSGPLQLGDEWIEAAAEVAKLTGFETEVDTNDAPISASHPMDHIALYAGWYSEHVCGPFSEPTVEFAPGAFAYHLHSFSAATLRSTSQNWVGPLLAKGVTATMGCVAEPYLQATPDIGTFLGRFLYFGFTFGESAYASQPTLSWQTTVVGDPLYRPFGRDPLAQHEQMKRDNSKYLEWAYLRAVNLALNKHVSIFQSSDYLENLPLTAQSPILKEKLGELYAAEGKPASTLRAFQQALQLHPSPQQRLRLRLNYGDRLLTDHQDAAAYADYQALLTEMPKYPGRLAVYRKLLPLAKKLDHPDDATKFQAEIDQLAPPPPAPATNAPAK